jgi:glycerophosphoryl diester phosphodiesterase
MGVPLIIAHRGDSANRPENTIAACKQAIGVGADVIEVDVQLSKDGHVLVIHDVSVNRTTDGTGSVREMTLAEVKKLTAGNPKKFGTQYKDEKVPTLGELLDAIRGKAKHLLVEIKHDSVETVGEEGIEAKVVAEIQKRRMEKDVSVISFERRSLVRCQKLAPEIRRGHIFNKADVADVLGQAMETGSDLVMPEKGMLSEELREGTDAAGLKVATWVIDDPAELRALSHFDLYGVGSNCPGVLIDALWSGD